MSVSYSCMVPIGFGFARTAEVQVEALKSAGLLGQLFDESSFWEPGSVNLGNMKDALFDGLVASYLDESKLFHGWNDGMLASMRTAKLRGAKTIVERQSVHVSVQSKLVGGVDALAERRMRLEYEEADVILVPSRFVEESFAKASPGLAGKVRRIALGVDAEKFKQISTFRHPFRALFVASNFDRKGGLYAVKAWQMARAQSKNARAGSLWIVGETPPGDMGPGVSQLGQLAEQDYVRTVQDSDVLLLPSLEDGFGLVVLEAMSAGKPVIISENVGAKDAVTEKEGYVVPVADAAKLARAIVSLADSHERRLEMGAQAHRASTRFTWQRYRDQYLALVKEMLA